MNKDWSQLVDRASQAGHTLLDELCLSGHSRESALAQIAALLRIPVLAPDALSSWHPDFTKLTSEQALLYGILPLTQPSGQAAVALTDPLSATLEDRMAALFSDAPSRFLIDPGHLAEFIRLRSQQPVPPRSGEMPDGDDRASQPVSGRVHAILARAMEAEASDIHLESTGSGLRVKYRLDGVLVPTELLDGVELAEQVISRLKILAELDIAERRIPQDGRFQCRLNARDIDFRVSIMPSLAGEDAVVRILDRQSLARDGGALTLDAIGFDDATLRALRRMIHSPYGMVLVTGPTGSGKTTTLYAALNEVNTGEDKIITIEDPVEYQLSDILQIPVNERKGLTFARGLRSILRHDPDKIMVGEIRDEETAEIAVQAALTGHLVFTTVHANNVFDVIGRFAHMGVDTFNFVASLTGIMAQRLVRRICPHCAEDVTPPADELTLAGLDPINPMAVRFRRGRGCPHCRQTGYKGRQAIAEILPLNDELRDLISSRASTSRLRAVAQAAGMQSLRTAALALVKSGTTTLQEANRVTLVE